MGSNPHAGHRERMRKRYLQEGPDGFADHELLEMLLFGIIPRGDVNEIAHNLLHTFGSFYNMITADPYEIAKLKDVGLNTGIFLSQLHELMRRCEREKRESKPVLSSPAASVNYCLSLLSNCLKERFYVVCMYARRNVLHHAMVSEGTLLGSTVLPRDVVEVAIRYRATSVLFCHNHPGGRAYPSGDDITLTLELKKLLSALEVQVIDHIIVAEQAYFSFAQNGLMKQGAMEKYLLRA